MSKQCTYGFLFCRTAVLSISLQSCNRRRFTQKAKSCEALDFLFKKKLTDSIEGEAVAPGVEGEWARLWPHPTDP